MRGIDIAVILGRKLCIKRFKGRFFWNIQSQDSVVEIEQYKLHCFPGFQTLSLAIHDNEAKNVFTLISVQWKLIVNINCFDSFFIGAPHPRALWVLSNWAMQTFSSPIIVDKFNLPHFGFISLFSPRGKDFFLWSLNAILISIEYNDCPTQK